MAYEPFKLDYDLQDTALEQFVSRYGIDKKPQWLQNQITDYSQPSKTESLVDKDPTANLTTDGFDAYLESKGAKPGETTPEKGAKGKDLLGKLGANTDELTQGTGALATKKMGAGDYADIALGMYETGRALTGKQFDTKGSGSGPGKAGGHIMKGAVTGFQAGMATGNPLIAAGGALVGAIAPAVGHNKAMKEWKDNQIAWNKKNDAIEEAKLEDAYAMAKGMASVQDLKSLRKKQLGILS